MSRRGSNRNRCKSRSFPLRCHRERGHKGLHQARRGNWFVRWPA